MSHTSAGVEGAVYSLECFIENELNFSAIKLFIISWSSPFCLRTLLYSASCKVNLVKK